MFFSFFYISYYSMFSICCSSLVENIFKNIFTQIILAYL
ncbi:hypothetical protein EUBDOL_00467 [Amedibacillus dolichus DSM 3991]|uniref:Uncharacterized protein n=1 Tax=Amedibacillus dolichus DSM 3991 TaxID=428127 RepID=A8R932_9FIRM|nr:hypothetical protein EUBDOL_00467 [Amedibacillus dolichus DSM 3991]